MNSDMYIRVRVEPPLSSTLSTLVELPPLLTHTKPPIRALSQINMQGYINSAVVGGRAGYIFNDIFAMGHDGEPQHPYSLIDRAKPRIPGNFLVDDYSSCSVPSSNLPYS